MLVDTCTALMGCTTRFRDKEASALLQAKKGRASGLKKGRSGVTLKDLMDGDVLAAGQNKIAVSYKGTTYTASLTKDGVIEYQGMCCFDQQMQHPYNSGNIHASCQLTSTGI